MNIYSFALLSVVQLLGFHRSACQMKYNREVDVLFVLYPGQKLSIPNGIQGAKNKSVSVKDNMECVFACIDVFWCCSVNFQPKPLNSSLFYCQLLSSEQFTHHTHMKRNRLYKHYSLKNPCEERPCFNGGGCIMQDNRQDYRCNCKIGFKGERCEIDIDECSNGQHTCHANANCNNNLGSYTCTCKSGYRGNGRSCTDIDECLNGQHTCHANANCNNNLGSYTCTCKSGYQGNGHSCTGSFLAVFNSLGANGRTGPTSIGSHYNGRHHYGQVTLSSGIQIWTVPYTATYQIEAVGASGGYCLHVSKMTSAYSGRGARMIGVFSFNKGELIKILVGQKGTNTPYKYGSASGGGGSYVVKYNNYPLIIAGGGAGIEYASAHYPSSDGTTSTSGNRGHGGKQWAGGHNGHGATKADSSNSGGGGGGFYSSGRSGTTFGGSSGSGGEGGKGFLQGGTGGRALYNSIHGGFGGGGGAYGGTHGGGAGGGGGYSGGASGDNNQYSSGGGGGSLNRGSHQNNFCCYNNNGNGYVIIRTV